MCLKHLLRRAKWSSSPLFTGQLIDRKKSWPWKLQLWETQAGLRGIFQDPTLGHSQEPKDGGGLSQNDYQMVLNSPMLDAVHGTLISGCLDNGNMTNTPTLMLTRDYLALQLMPDRYMNSCMNTCMNDPPDIAWYLQESLLNKYKTAFQLYT